MSQQKQAVEFDTYLDYVQDRASMGDFVLSEHNWMRLRDEQIIELLWGNRHAA